MKNENGGYDLEGVIWHQHSNRLMAKIIELWPDTSVSIADLGCGHNFYCSVLNYANYDAWGFDMVDLGSLYFSVADITKPIENKPAFLEAFSHKPTNVISLEVGEHIPLEKSDGYLDNVCSFGGDVIMSWAVKGQAGVGHINCQSNDWVIDKMAERGYLIDFKKTEELRNAVYACHCSWFTHTLMYFSK